VQTDQGMLPPRQLSGARRGEPRPVPKKVVDLRLIAGALRAPAARLFLPAEFSEPLVIDAEIVADLVDDGTADLFGDFPLAMADRANGLAKDGDPVWQHPRVS
jgi:hypothetical protein